MNSLTDEDSASHAPKEDGDSAIRQQGDDNHLTDEKSCTTVKQRKRSSLSKLNLNFSQATAPSDPMGSPGSPESDGDILGILDHSPDSPDQTSAMASGLGPKFNPYSCVFENLRFSELMPHVFLRDQSITLRVVEMDMLPSALNFFNQSVFTIILHHGSTHWTITKKSRQISSLHNQLRLFKTMLKLPAATSEERERRQSMRMQMKNKRPDSGEEGQRVKSNRLVKFPRKSLQRMDRYTVPDVELYLNNLLHHSFLRSHCAVLEFFEISPVSFVRHLGPKMKEGYLKKRSGGRSALACCGGQYKRRWLVLRETCIFCLSPGGGTIRTVMLIDSGFQVSHGFRHTRITKGLLITNLSRSLILKCDGEETAREWNSAIEHARNTYATDFCRTNRHLSFAPVRKRSQARWYVDGSWYMSDVADLLELAQDEIFITDWWLSPDIYMKRPDLTGRQWKLNEILKRQAARGVRVFILLYKEVELALGLNSLYTKQNLCQVSPNIKVLRHPDHYKGSLYWAHHEKMVIVDQMYAFVGGIDLCYGRWDDYRHKLVDVGHAGRVPQKPQDTSLGRLILNTHDLFMNGMSTLSVDEVGNKSPETLEAKEEPASKVAPRDQESERAVNSESQGTPEKENLVTPLETHSAEEDGVSNTRNLDSKSRSSPSESNRNGVKEFRSGGSASNGSEKSFMKVNDQSDMVDDSHVNLGPVLIMNGCVEESISYREGLFRNTDRTSLPTRGPARSPLTFSEGDDTESNSKSSLSEASSESDNSDIFIPDEHCGNDERKRSFGNGSGNDTEEWEVHLKRGVQEEEEREILCQEDQQKTKGKISRNFKAVKSLGMDLVVEMKERRKEMKHWTEKKVPGLRRASSFDSEIGLSTCSEDDEMEEISFGGKSSRLRRKLKRRLKSRVRPTKLSRSCSTGSLFELHKELTYEDVTSTHLWLGKDYVNWITKDLYDPQIPFSDNVNRLQTPRMPWHDIALYVEGPVARDAARHFIERWNAVKSEKMKNNERYQYLIPKTYKPSSFIPSTLEPKHLVKCQVVRSLGLWSGGLNETERSIYNAYLDAIKGAKHFIYIENQFFISSAYPSRSEVSNSIAYELAQRIIKSHRNNQTFRVYIVLPLLPAFEGQIGTPSGVAMQYILHYTYQSIISGPNSLIGVLLAANVNWQHYLSFCSLRTHDVLEGQLVSELIYVHSKLMIVDDRLVIAGSANINDRSLLGNRDSEVALVIEDEEFCKGKMNGRDHRRGQFAGSLRMYLFSEHLGLTDKDDPIDVSDPTSENFFIRTWQAIASKNTKVFDEVFSCIPCDSVTTFAELKKLRSEVPFAKNFPEKAKQSLKSIQGRLVLYPLKFLKNETLKPGPTNKEFLLPVDMWV